jgi:hypothetical protein
MNAILIDPFKQEITEMDWDGDYMSIAKILDCQWITGAYPPDMDHDVIYVDDEGLYVDDQRFFMISGYPHPIAGYGLILGTDEVGDAIPPKSNVDELAKRIFFVDVI